ncbi:RAD55 family ATPase [Haloarchaeobius sp. DFWS5]|uniref:RAD55 family ATPase n=1 Tax=Haloarchaeobius sp. DFWS5 TaxID=3446114 RepID=UPI003EC0C301
MYDVSDVLPVAALRPGTNLLVTGPPMTGKYDLCCALLRDGHGHGDSGLFLTTQHVDDDVRSDVDRPADTPPLAVVDCVSRERGRDVTDDHTTRYVSSPGDFTAAGMSSSRLLDIFDQRDVRTRVVVDSISTLLGQADVKTVFRFLHILSGRISAADGVGFATLDATQHDGQTNNTVRQLFDGLVETRNGEAGRELRVVGLGDGPTDWERF